MSTISTDIEKVLNNQTNKEQMREKKIQEIFKSALQKGTAVVNILSNTGIAGFKFHIIQSEQVKMQSEITDHYVDTNVVVQDHIAKKPVIVTLRGFQGDYFYSVNEIEDTLATVTTVMSVCKQLLPQLPPAAKEKIVNTWNNITGDNKTTNDIGGSVETYNTMDLFTLFQSLCKLKSAQTRAYFFLRALWQAGALFSVETTYERFDDMVIQDLAPLRDKNADITDFTVTFKQMRFTNSLYRSYENAAGRTREQLAKIQKKGVQKGTSKAAV